MTMQHEMMPFFGRREPEVPKPPLTERVLGPDERVQIAIDAPLDEYQELYSRSGLQGRLMATVLAGGKNFMIVDTRNTSSNRDFLIADDTFSKDSEGGFKGIPENEPVLIGRYHYKDRFQYPATVSGTHFEVFYTGDSLFINNLRPTNRTVVTAHLDETPQPEVPLRRPVVENSRTINVEKRLQSHPNYGEKDETAPYGYYLNHPILGRASTSVDGGVYLGGHAREAIVVDGKSSVLKQVYREVATDLHHSFANNETLPVRSMLLRVMNKVQEVMPYDGPKTEFIGREHHGDKLIGLSTYVTERAGVCRHQGLLAAYIIEHLIRDGQLPGTVGVERNTVEDLGGTHAWAVYKTMHNGEQKVIVVDPAQSFVGTKAQAQRENRWEYRLTTDDYR